jgi:hypothetical protein
MLCRYDVLRAVTGLAIAAAAGCGSKGADRPDAAPGVDAADIDAAVDPSRGAAITIKTFPGTLPTYDGRTANASLVAFQDGDGAWVALAGTGGVYHATATGPRYGVAVGCATEGGPAGVHLYYQSVSDTAEVLADGCAVNTSLLKLSIDLQGLPAGQTAEAWLGADRGVADSGSPLEVDHPRGMADLFLRTFTRVEGQRVVHAFVRGGTIDLQADTAVQIDLATQGLPPERHPLRLAGLKPDGSVRETYSVMSSYATAHSELQWPLDSQDFDDPAPDSYVTIDATLRKLGDISNFTVFAFGTTTDGRDYERYMRVAQGTPGPVTATLLPIWTATAPSVDRTGVPRATLTLPITPGTLGTSDYHASLSTSSAGVFPHTLAVTIRPGWAAGAASVTITTPDLTGVAGWTADMGLATDTAVDWNLEWDDRNMPYEALPTDGRKILATIISGQVAAP